jgi:uncharacterized protein (TIGR00369 family)
MFTIYHHLDERRARNRVVRRMSEPIAPGERFHAVQAWESNHTDSPHIWRTLGYRRLAWEPGGTSVEWVATTDYCFPTANGSVVHGGLVTALLDTAMGGACWTVLDHDEVFLTADLHVEFLRTARPGALRADGRVVRRSRRVVFCSAEMRDAEQHLLATSRCTQIVLPDQGPFGRPQPATGGEPPPEDARG